MFVYIARSLSYGNLLLNSGFTPSNELICTIGATMKNKKVNTIYADTKGEYTRSANM